MEFLQTLADDVWASPAIVWWAAFLLSGVTAWILHAYNDNALLTGVISVAMYFSVAIGNVGFNRLGVMFSPNSDANVIAAASVSMCAVVTMTLILAHVFFAFGDVMQKRRYRDEPVSDKA